MVDEPRRILLIEDDRVDQLAFVRLSKTGALPYRFDIAGSVAEAGTLLAAGRYDVALADHALGDGTAFDLLDAFRAGGVLPIMITGLGDESVAVRAMKAGFADYVVKDRDRHYLTALPQTIEKALHNRELEIALHQSEARFESAFEFAAIGIALVAPDGRWLKVNRALCALVGYSADELMATTFQDLTHPDDLAIDLRYKRQVLSGEIQTYQLEKRYIHRSGALVWVLLSVSLVRDRDGRPLHFISQIQDISERKRAELAIVRQNAELSALNQLGRALSRLAKPAELLEFIYSVVGQVLDNRNFYIALYDDAGQTISFPVYYIDAQRIARAPRAVGNGLTECMIRTKQPLFLPRDVLGAARERGVEPQGRPAQCYLGVPLLVADKVIGAIAVQDYEHADVYDPAHVELLGTIAAQASIALENARLFEATQQLALTDALTGIANRRHLFELGEQEMSRSRRFGHPLAALMLDIDHFKHVNDTCGHTAGDEVLRSVARGCLAHFRDIDIVARYGGEEFVVLLLETDFAGARISAERLCACVSQAVTVTPAGPVTVTISIGVAGALPSGDTFTTLLARADAALYAAKQAGRNRVGLA